MSEAPTPERAAATPAALTEATGGRRAAFLSYEAAALARRVASVVHGAGAAAAADRPSQLQPIRAAQPEEVHEAGLAGGRSRRRRFGNKQMTGEEPR